MHRNYLEIDFSITEVYLRLSITITYVCFSHQNRSICTFQTFIFRKCVISPPIKLVFPVIIREINLYM